jgi:ClpP class serine protease
LSLAKVRELADGRVYVGQAAVERNLIDGIQSLDDTFSQLLAASQRRKSRMNANLEPDAALAADLTAQAGTGGANPSPATPAPAPAPAAARPASYHELKAALAGADPAFLTSQLDANATVEQARNAWMAKLSADNQALAKKNAELEQQHQAGGTPPTNNQGKKPGVPGLVADATTPPASYSGDAIAEFESQVAANVKAGMPRANAVSRVISQQPELHAAYLQAKNPSRHKQRQLSQRIGLEA